MSSLARSLPSPPLTRRELDSLLQSLFHDTQADPKVSLEAFTATAMALYSFCPADEVDAALLSIPRATSTFWASA